MAKKSKNSKLWVHYSRTMTPESLSRATNYVGNYILKGLGAFGKIMTAPLTGGPMGTSTVPLYPKTVLLANAERKLRETQEELIGKAMTWVSPLNYGAALATGNGLNARKGEEEVASWSPAWQAVGRLGELYVGPKAVKGVKATPRVVVNTAEKAGVKPAKAAVVAREIKQGIKLNTKNGRIEVTGNYFNSPDKWYRITETPEKYGIMELGKNVTTHDAALTVGTINGWRSSILKAPITKSSEGFIKRPHKIEVGIRRKNGQAHGNTSQAAKGKLWGGTTSGSNLFPEGVIEGQAPSMINYGIDRTNFVITPWELVPNGGRVGFHTGEMPMSNLGWFQRTNKGTYTYEPIIPEKRISYQPKLLLDSPTSLKFFERKPSTSHNTNFFKEAEQYALRDNTGGSSKITVPDVYKSLTEAEEYKGSRGYKDLVHRAQKEAKEMGLPFSSDLYIGVNNYIPNIKLSPRPKGKLGGYRKSTNTIELDPDLLSPIEGKYVPFHEGLHWQRVGDPQMNSPLYNRWKENMQDDLAWREFYKSEEYKNLAYEDNAKAYARNKVKEALYEDADPYLSIPGELLVNGLESGRAIGLEPFAEYPGYGKALEAVKKARNYNSWLNDVKAGTTLEMQNFWKILTGNYLPAVSIPLTTGYTLHNIFNQPLQQLQY